MKISKNTIVTKKGSLFHLNYSPEGGKKSSLIKSSSRNLKSNEIAEVIQEGNLPPSSNSSSVSVISSNDKDSIDIQSNEQGQDN